LDGGFYVPRGALDNWKQAAKPPTTTLATAITTTGQTSVTVASVEGWPNEMVDGQFLVLIGSEQVYVTATAGSTTWTLVRGCNGTTASTYTVGARVTGDAALKIVTMGDSTAQAGPSGANGWDGRLARLLSKSLGLDNLNPTIGPGYIPIFRNDDANIGGGGLSGDTSWTAQGGTWTKTTANTVNDLAVFNWSVTASGSANILKLVPVTQLGDIKCIDVHYVDATGVVWSYDINNSGSWVNAAGAGVHNVEVKRARITNGTAITDFRIRAANAAGTSMAARIIGVRVYATAPTFGTTSGVEVWNLAHSGDFLSQFNRTNVNGDNFRQFQGAQGSIFPDLALIGPFTNDVIVGTWAGEVGSSAAAVYQTNLQAVVNALPASCDKVLIAHAEQPGRRIDEQANLRKQIHDVAEANGCAYFDLYDAWAADGMKGNDAVVSAGLMDSGNVHLNDFGYRDMASRLHRMLINS
jgi:lysophospholipase L1-like esterase